MALSKIEGLVAGLPFDTLRVARATEEEEAFSDFKTNKISLSAFLCDSVRDKRSWSHTRSPSTGSGSLEPQRQKRRFWSYKQNAFFLRLLCDSVRDNDFLVF
jgi:hypothetical protein